MFNKVINKIYSNLPGTKYIQKFETFPEELQQFILNLEELNDTHKIMLVNLIFEYGKKMEDETINNLTKGITRSLFGKCSDDFKRK
jgi:undecaprenyl pyrophosphate synthase